MVDNAAMHNAIPLTSSDRVRRDEAELPTRTLLEGIAKRLCVTATYNRMTMRLAPHIVYTRHGELHVDAVTLERDGKAPKEMKLGTFKLSGLGGTALTGRPFATFAAFDSRDEKYAGVTIFAIGG